MSSPASQPALRPVSAALPRCASLRVIAALILREMATRYGRSPGGYLWAVLEPVAGIALLVVIFSVGFRSPPLGQNFALFYASGLLPFLMFTAISGHVAQGLNQSRPLLAYPRVSFLDALLARFLLTALTQGVVSAALLGAILAFFETRAALDPLPLLQAFALAAALGLGVGLLNTVLISRHPVWQSVWSVLMRPMVLLSGVIVLQDDLPQPWRGWLEWNPLVHVSGLARAGFYHGYDPDWVTPLYATGVALGAGVFGLLMLTGFHRDLLER